MVTYHYHHLVCRPARRMRAIDLPDDICTAMPHVVVAAVGCSCTTGCGAPTACSVLDAGGTPSFTTAVCVAGWTVPWQCPVLFGDCSRTAVSPLDRVFETSGRSDWASTASCRCDCCPRPPVWSDCSCSSQSPTWPPENWTAYDTCSPTSIDSRIWTRPKVC